MDRTGVPLANGFPGWSVNKTHHLRRWVQMLVGDALRGGADILERIHGLSQLRVMRHGRHYCNGRGCQDAVRKLNTLYNSGQSTSS